METLRFENKDIAIKGYRPVMVSGVEKLGQTIYEILLIEIQENGYGSDLIYFTQDNIHFLIKSALERFKAMQDSSTVERTPEEILADIVSIDVKIEGTDAIFSIYLRNVIGEQFAVVGGIAR